MRLIFHISFFFFFLVKPLQEFEVTTTLRDRTYEEAYDDMESADARGLAQEFEDVFDPMFRTEYPDYDHLTVTKFFPGSVGVIFRVFFKQSSNVTSETIVEKLQEVNATKRIQFVVLGKRISVTEVKPVILPPSVTATPTTGTCLLFYKKKC